VPDCRRLRWGPAANSANGSRAANRRTRPAQPLSASIPHKWTPFRVKWLTSNIPHVRTRPSGTLDDVLRQRGGSPRTRLHRTNILGLLISENTSMVGAGTRPTKPRWEGKISTVLFSRSPIAGKVWAAPKGRDGKIDLNRALTADDLRDFRQPKALPLTARLHPKGHRTKHHRIQDRAKSSERSKTKSPAAINLAKSSTTSTSCRFRSKRKAPNYRNSTKPRQKHGQRRTQWGEYYTPRPLICAIVR